MSVAFFLGSEIFVYLKSVVKYSLPCSLSLFLLKVKLGQKICDMTRSGAIKVNVTKI